jgi:lysophospholipase L1-like esterase
MSDRNVFLIGDSISIQYGPSLATYLSPDIAYARKSGLNDALRDLDVPQGANGGDSAMVLEYLSRNDRHAEIRNVDLLVINCGLHDIKTSPQSGKRQVEPGDYRSNLERIVELSRGLCRQFVWVSTTPCVDAIHNSRSTAFYRYREDVVRYNEIASSIMSANDVPIIDLFALTEALERELGESVYKDHVHFPPEVCRTQAAYLAGWIRAFCQLR